MTLLTSTRVSAFSSKPAFKEPTTIRRKLGNKEADQIISIPKIGNTQSQAAKPLGTPAKPGFGNRRPFSSSTAALKGLSPESENPQPKEAEPHAAAKAPAQLSKEEYDELSDAYMDSLLAKMESMAEEQGDVDVEYSAGVLTFAHPNGVYVINKQPPNKQIWLSSPISGPKRYDFVHESEGQDAKEGTGTGAWVYLRDGTTLSDVLSSEIGVVVEDEFAGGA